MISLSDFIFSIVQHDFLKAKKQVQRKPAGLLKTRHGRHLGGTGLGEQLQQKYLS